MEAHPPADNKQLQQVEFRDPSQNETFLVSWIMTLKVICTQTHVEYSGELNTPMFHEKSKYGRKCVTS